MVIDPNESWSEFISSMAGFDDPKMVPLDSLPEDFDPKQRKFHTLKSIINWRNQNYIENWKPKRADTTGFKDLEKQVIVEQEDKPAEAIDQVV